MKRLEAAAVGGDETAGSSEGATSGPAYGDDVVATSLRELRQKAGLTLEAVGKILGQTAAGIHKTESQEKTGKVSILRLSETARALGYELHYGFLPTGARSASGLSLPTKAALVRPPRKQHLKFDHRTTMKKLVPLKKVAVKELHLDPHTRLLSTGPEEVALTPAEVLLLHRLMTARGKRVTQENLMTLIWDESSDQRRDALRTLASKIRAKLIMLGIDPAALEAHYGQGYKLKLE